MTDTGPGAGNPMTAHGSRPGDRAIPRLQGMEEPLLSSGSSLPISVRLSPASLLHGEELRLQGGDHAPLSSIPTYPHPVLYHIVRLAEQLGALGFLDYLYCKPVPPPHGHAQEPQESSGTSSASL
jgi:hypothetical protein